MEAREKMHPASASQKSDPPLNKYNAAVHATSPRPLNRRMLELNRRVGGDGQGEREDAPRQREPEVCPPSKQIQRDRPCYVP